MKADQKQMTRLLKTARGQIDGILKMIEEDRYCLDISHQIMAADAILRRANKELHPGGGAAGGCGQGKRAYRLFRQILPINR